jgi:hypothetical protein
MLMYGKEHLYLRRRQGLKGFMLIRVGLHDLSRALLLYKVDIASLNAYTVNPNSRPS